MVIRALDDVASNIWLALRGGGGPLAGVCAGAIRPQLGKAVQLDPIKATFKAPGSERLKL